ncbi:Hypothetical protein NTJ_15506 [Nesidiocoris tenuis]|uniref:HCLS1-associated protein X-1 n=1 Tax=Nesidiocoris tenuis TaxID=355587 RepID=A0ABN7BE93_9HEMI|nr:Hypothetical protein NTJ_15506 [Nesidiocoris tenuis]
MDGFDLFRRFLGIPRDDGFPSRNLWIDDDDDEGIQEFPNNSDDDVPDGFHGFAPPNRGGGHGFNIFFGDPFEMQRDFERQFEEVMRNMMGVFSGFNSHITPALPNRPFDGEPPSIHPSIEPQDESPRNRYLKPSYERIPSSSGARADSDLDGRISSSEIGTIFDEQPTNREERRIQNSATPFFFGQSSVTKTVRGPDGRVEHHKTFKSSDGTEHTTVTRQLGDKSHSITVKRMKDGTSEQEENFVNMSEGELSQFDQLWSGTSRYSGQPSIPALPTPDGSNSLVDRMLKWFK